MKELLNKLNACSEAIEWVGDKSLEQAWNTCHRGDWMLWLYKKLYPDNQKELTLAKGHCANTVRHLMEDQRSLDAVDAAIAFGEGRITSEELKKAASDAYAASDAASYAAYAASYAADAASYAADAASYAADASYDAAAAAYTAAAYIAAAYTASAEAEAAYAEAAASYTAADAAYAADAAAAYAAITKNQQETADICRKYLTI